MEKGYAQQGRPRAVKKSINLSTNKSTRPDSFTGKFYQIVREELTSILLKFFPKISEGGILLNSF